MLPCSASEGEPRIQKLDGLKRLEEDEAVRFRM